MNIIAAVRSLSSLRALLGGRGTTAGGGRYYSHSATRNISNFVQQKYIECNAYIECGSIYRLSICLSYDKLDILLCNWYINLAIYSIYFAEAKWVETAERWWVVHSRIVFFGIKQKSDCFFYLSGLREGDHCAINCCLDKLNSGRVLNIKIKLGRLVESSRCVSIVEATLPLP